LARASGKFRCPVCCCEGETCADLLPELKAKGSDGDEAKKMTKFQEEIEKLKMLQFQNHAVEENEIKGDGKKEDATKSESAEGVAEEKQPAQPKNDDASVAPTPPPDSSLQEPDSKPAEKKANQSPEGAATSQPNTSPPEAPHQRATDNNTTIEPSNVPRPPPVPANSAQAATETPAIITPAVATAAAATTNNNAPVVSDRLLNGAIGFFAVFVVVLLRQAQSLVDELHGLEDGN